MQASDRSCVKPATPNHQPAGILIGQNAHKPKPAFLVREALHPNKLQEHRKYGEKRNKNRPLGL